MVNSEVEDDKLRPTSELRKPLEDDAINHPKVMGTS